MSFWGAPSSADDDLPDADQMALLGDGRNSSQENVDFWEERSAAVPTSVAFRTRLAAAHLTLAADTGDLAVYAVGEDVARAALELEPGSIAARLVLADALAARHDFRGALGLAEGVLADDPTSVAALLAAGDAQLELGDDVEARRRYDAAARHVGGEPAVSSRFARLEATTGTLDAAIDRARAALVAAGDDDLRHADAAFYWFQLATYEYRSGRYEHAADRLDAALRIDPTHGGALELLAKVRTATGDWDAAIVAYESLVADGGAADLHGELAELYRRVGRVAEAEEQVALGLALAHRDADRFPAERRHLIGFLVEHDPAEALRLAELDLTERGDVFAHAWYAWALHRTGDHQAAARAIVPALRHGTQDAMLRYQAGMIFVAAGDRARGVELLRSALDLHPAFDLASADEARLVLERS